MSDVIFELSHTLCPRNVTHSRTRAYTAAHKVKRCSGWQFVDERDYVIRFKLVFAFR